VAPTEREREKYRVWEELYSMVGISDQSAISQRRFYNYEV